MKNAESGNISEILARFDPECDLENERFHGLELIGTDLQRSKIIDCVFEDCILSAVDLKDTNLQASFVNCKVQGINFFTAKRTFLSVKFERCLIRYSSFAELTLNSPEDGIVKLKKSEITSRERGLSSMPEGLTNLLTRRDLRDLVEFLSSLK